MNRRFLQTQGRTNRNQVWTIEVKDHKTVVTWQQEDGKVQTTVQVHQGVNDGKANYRNPQQVAQDWAERQVLLKRREGYREVDITGHFLEEEAVGTVMSVGALPPNLRFYKPQNSLSKYLEDQIERKRAWFVQKRNGEMMAAALGEDGWRLYSSKMLLAHKNEVGHGIPWSERFPHLIASLQQLNVPVGSVLLGELVAGREVDDLQRVGSVMKSLTPRALELQQLNPLWFCCWDVAYWAGRCVAQEVPYQWRWDLIVQFSQSGPPYITRPEKFQGLSQREALEMAKQNGWEGWVVLDPYVEGYGDKALSFHGKADRPLSCGKLKPTLEADFIARWDPDNGIGEWGRGKNADGVGSLALYLWDPLTQQEIYVSKCGGGLKDQDVRNLADPALYPLAVQVEFASWTTAGSLQFPQFLRVRTDKDPQDCTLDQRGGSDEVE